MALFAAVVCFCPVFIEALYSPCLYLSLHSSLLDRDILLLTLVPCEMTALWILLTNRFILDTTPSLLEVITIGHFIYLAFSTSSLFLLFRLLLDTQKQRLLTSN